MNFKKIINLPPKNDKKASCMYMWTFFQGVAAWLQHILKGVKESSGNHYKLRQSLISSTFTETLHKMMSDT